MRPEEQTTHTGRAQADKPREQTATRATRTTCKPKSHHPKWTAPPKTAFVLPFGCQSRLFPPPFFLDAYRVYLKGPRIPIESPSWYDRISWQNPVGVTRPVPPGRWPFLCPSAFRRVGLEQLRFPFFPGLATGSVLLATPALRLAGSASFGPAGFALSM
jgi:hypothetical protein